MLWCLALLSPLLFHQSLCLSWFFFFFFNDTATPEISPLPLPAALPISPATGSWPRPRRRMSRLSPTAPGRSRSEEHTSELQSPDHLVCRLLLEKKKKQEECLMTCCAYTSHTPAAAENGWTRRDNLVRTT